MTSRKELILVTGASGFVGAQAVEHILSAGYTVRGTCRSTKANNLQKNCNHPNFEVVVVDDFIEGDLSEVLKGVNTVLHIASPSGLGENHIEVAVNGTLNLLRQAHAAKVYKVIIMSSCAASVTFTTNVELFDPSWVVNERDWNRVTKDEALRPGNSPFFVYASSKALAERAAWEFADSHPEMDIITLLPPFIYGPLAPFQDTTGPSHGLSTNRHIYHLISGVTAAYPPRTPPQFVDVRDVAKACLLSLQITPAKPGEKRRILLHGGSFTWQQAARHIGIAKPQLVSRLVNRGEDMAPAIPCASIDTAKAKELLGMSEFIDWRKSIEDTVDSLLEREQMWRK